jgi:hypothetical protein
LLTSWLLPNTGCTCIINIIIIIIISATVTISSVVVLIYLVDHTGVDVELQKRKLDQNLEEWLLLGCYAV